MPERYVLITGASKGIGRAAALHLDKLGFKVFAGVRKPEDGEALRREASDRLRPVQIDVTDSAQIAAAAAYIGQIAGDAGLYGLVNNAGVGVGFPIEILPLDDLRYQMEVNFFGQVAVTQAMMPLIRKATGRIVNISSVGGLMVVPMAGAYSASKFALEALTDSLRMELRPWGIKVVAIEPGEIATPIWDTMIKYAEDRADTISEEDARHYRQRMEKTRDTIQRGLKYAAPPQIVADVIGRALTVKHPRARYLVGLDARLMVSWMRYLPAGLRDRLLSVVG